MDAHIMLPAGASEAERFAAQAPAERAARLDAWSIELLRNLWWSWHYWARAEQMAPPGDWRTWLILAGRGFGKTRAGAEWVRAQAEADGRLRIALVAATMAEARAVMVEGESGLLAIAPPGNRPNFEPSLRRLTWRSGAQAFLYSASEPESLRGAQHHIAWADEIAKWPRGMEAWDNLAMGLRLGATPRIVATTTPRPVALVRRLGARHCPRWRDPRAGAIYRRARGRLVRAAGALAARHRAAGEPPLHASRRSGRRRTTGGGGGAVAALAQDAPVMSGELAGRMRERVTLLTPSAGRDALGGAEEDWTLVDIVWAAVEPAGRGPFLSGDARAALPLWKLTLRPCAVQVGDRIERTSGTVEVREVRRDPALPDRIVAIGEEIR